MLQARAAAVGQDTVLSIVGYANPDSPVVAGGKEYPQVHTSPIYFQVRKRIGHSGVLEAHQGMGVVFDTHNILYFPTFNNEGERTDRIWLPSNNPPSFDLCSKRRFSVMA